MFRAAAAPDDLPTLVYVTPLFHDRQLVLLGYPHITDIAATTGLVFR